MKKTAILIPRGETLSSAVVAPYVIFSRVNEWQQSIGRHPAFDVHLVSCESTPSLEGGAFTVQPHCQLAQAAGYELAIVPGFSSDASQTMLENQPLIRWLKTQHVEHDMEMASLCSGAFFIAATGCADGRKMTTHWAYEAEFRAQFPKVKLRSDRIVTDDGGIYASGGAYSSLSLLMYLLEKFCDKGTAVWASKVFQIDMNRTSQKPFVIFNNQKNHPDESIQQVQEYIERCYGAHLTINDLAQRFGFSRRNFLRRFKQATGNTPIEYLQRVRIEAAKRLLERSTKNVEEIVASAGYSDSKTFRALFKKYTGFSPTVYRSRYQV